MNSTTCLVCSRSGGGWSVRKVLNSNELIPGSKIMLMSTGITSLKIGLKQWVNNSGFCTWEDDPHLVTAIYLYNLTAPGEWCQIFWECKTPELAERLKLKLKNDIAGIYIVSKVLSDLTPAEIEYYYNDQIKS